MDAATPSTPDAPLAPAITPEAAAAPTVPLVAHVAEVVSAYVAHNSVPAAEMPGLIAAVHGALAGLDAPAAPAPADQVRKASRRQIADSITADHLVSFEDGERYRSLKRHLAGRGLTPAQYRDKWGLPEDYPMVAPTYAARRSELAKAQGLGARRAGQGR